MVSTSRNLPDVLRILAALAVLALLSALDENSGSQMPETSVAVVDTSR
jgi:hypothetical protein